MPAIGVAQATPMPTPDPHLDQLLRTAIQQARLLQLRDRIKDRIGEPQMMASTTG
jgi:hypothetical protein